MFDIFYISNPPKDYPQAIKVKDRNEAREKSRTRFCWLLDGHNYYGGFDMLWEPVPWEANQVHVWPSQHQEHGGTELIPKDWNGDVNYHKEIVFRGSHPKIVYLEHGNMVFDHVPVSFSTSRFINDYLGTLKRVVNKFKDEEYLWVISSVCNYHDFHFNWHPSEWQRTMLHVFPSNEQKFGDTFYIHVPSFLEQAKNLELLEWYDTICFQDIEVERPYPTMYVHNHDSQVDAVKSILFQKIEEPESFNDPLILFSNTTDIPHVPTVNLWRPETRTITPLTKSGSQVIVPKDALTEIKDEMYDYPYLSKKFNNTTNDKPLDIIFLSNGEACAEENYKHLMDCTKHLSQKKLRVDGVDGRLKAYQVCARKATTDWFFVVYAKLKANKDFDWNWQPDRLQKKKHYIFYAYNPITDDTYGHMAMIAFNKQLVLEHDGQGIDFSMHQEHEVVPLLSGEAIYANKPWDAWRTAFREVVKLLDSDDPDAPARIEKWMQAKEEWTQQGARDAKSFYEKNPDKIRLTYEWDWLAKYFYMAYITY